MIYTYVFHNNRNGLTKIGRSKSPAQRFEELGRDRELVFIAAFEGDREKEMHAEHAVHRAEGEWFVFEPAQLCTFRLTTEFDSPPEGDPVYRTSISIASKTYEKLMATRGKGQRFVFSHYIEGLLERDLGNAEAQRDTIRRMVSEELDKYFPPRKKEMAKK